MLLDPRRFHAGETVTWSLSQSLFTTDTQDLLGEGGARLTLGIANAGGAVAITGDLDGGVWTLQLTVAVSETLAAGSYAYQLVAEVVEDEAVTRRRVEAVGYLQVLPLADGSVAVDARTGWQRVYDDLMAAYQDYVSTGALRGSYSVDGRSASFTSHAEILAAIERARAEVKKDEARERMRQGLHGFPKIFTRYPL